MLIVLAATVFTVAHVTPPKAAYIGSIWKQDPNCVRVVGVVPDGPSAKAGLKEGMCIVTLNGKRVISARELVAKITIAPLEQEITLTNKEGQTIVVHPSELTKTKAAELCELDRSVRRQITINDLNSGRGLQVVSLERSETIGSIRAKLRLGKNYTLFWSKCGAAQQEVIENANDDTQLNPGAHIAVNPVRRPAAEHWQAPDGSIHRVEDGAP